MHHIIYMSRSHERYSDEQLSKILESARRNNSALGVTGLLLYAGNTFFQVLEGPKYAVDQIYDRVFMDDRHAQVKMLASYAVEERQFPDWSMGFRRLEEEDIECEEFFDLTKATWTDRVPQQVSDATINFVRSFADTKIRAA